MAKTKVVVSWSSGKDSAYALHRLQAESEHEIVGLLTSISSEYQRVAIHGVRETVLDRQAEALGLSLYKIRLPSPCTNEVYEEKFSQVLEELRNHGVTHLAFGDLFLVDVRNYREKQL